MKTENYLELLYRSLDGDLEPEEVKMLEEALAQSEELQKEKEEALRIRELLGAQEYSFSHGFVDAVMDRIGDKEPIVREIVPFKELYFVFKRIAIAGAAAIAILLLSIYLSSGSLNLNSLFGVEKLSEDDLITYLLIEK
jgi:hypothetical protein